MRIAKLRRPCKIKTENVKGRGQLGEPRSGWECKLKLDSGVRIYHALSIGTQVPIYHALSIGTYDSDELYPSFIMVRQSFFLDLFDSEERSTWPFETLVTICQSTWRHIVEDLNLANNNNNNNGRYERHVGVWGSGSTA